MPFKRHIQYIVIFLLASFSSHAIGVNAISQIDVSSGLSHNGVTSMIEDSRGYLWIGTYDGLNLYNGNTVTIYKNTPTQKVLGSNRVRCICEDSKGRLWIGTESGVTLFDFEHNEFNLLPIVKDGVRVDNNTITIKKIFFDKESRQIICFTEWSDVLVFDEDGNMVAFEQTLAKRKHVLNDVIKVSNHYLLATNNGLLSYTQATEPAFTTHTQYADVYSSLIEIKNKRLLVLSANKISVLSYAVDVDNQMQLALEETCRPLSGVEYQSIFRDSHGRFYLGTLDDGVYANNSTYKTMSASLGRTSPFRTSGFLETGNNYCWVYTFDSGVFCYPLDENPFNVIAPESRKRIWSSYPYDRDRVIYVDGNIISIYNTASGKYEEFPYQLPRESVAAPKIIFRAKDGTLLLVVYNREKHLFFTLKNGAFKREPHITMESKRRLMPTYIEEDNVGNIWICYDSELFRATKNASGEIVSTESIHLAPALQPYSLGRIRELYFKEDSNSMWICTEKDGLFVLNNIYADNLNKITVANYRHQQNNTHSLPVNFISTAVKDNNGVMWLGTEGGGLCKVDESEADNLKFTYYTEADGLSNNVVKSILCDHNNNLWVATNIGLSVFDVLAEKFHVYRRKDGLPVEEFSYNSFIFDNGNFFFRGNQDAVYFNPQEITVKGSFPEFQFGELAIYEQTIHPQDSLNGRCVIDKRLEDGDTLRLLHNENSFSINIESLHYGDNNSHFIRYKLTPISQRWTVQHANQSNINFNAIRPGEYVLEISVSNLIGDWTPSKQITVIVEPPFNETPHFYAICIIVCILLIYIAIRIIVRFQLLSHNLRLESLEKDLLKKANEEKHRFFANTSHELKTPLTVMSAPIASLQEAFQGDPSMQSKVYTIQRQANKMIQLVDAALNIQLDEYNLLQLKPTVFNFSKLLRELVEDFSYVATRDRKTLELRNAEQDIFVEADQSMLEKVINNIINNAFKYTQSGDTITVDIAAHETLLSLTIADTGLGISAQDMPHIFERYYHGGGSHAPSGTGIGLAFSKRLVELHLGTITAESIEDEGATFVVAMPIVTDVQDRVVDEPATEPDEPLSSNVIMSNLNDIPFQLKNDYHDTTIFLVEDNAEVRHILMELLSRLFNVEEFDSGVACLEAMNSRWPDLILSDVMMPNMSGFELCHTIKSNMLTSHIPIILITACAGIEDRIEGLQNGADAYIPKPFNPKHVIVRIETLLENRQRLRERYQVGIPISMDNNKEDHSKDNEFLVLLYEKLNDNLDKEIELGQFSIEMGMNRTYLFKKIKALTNKTPAEFIKEFRLTRAAELLQSQKYSITQVCEMTGFKSRGNFGKLFKERYGVAPSKYAEVNNGE